jgi:hypothetical protein
MQGINESADNSKVQNINLFTNNGLMYTILV